MCNIAGYIGRREAAPILIDMMRREEGYAGGYYTGMTVHDGERLVTAKVMGDLECLLDTAPCRDFRGSCGFIHSRSKSGGGPEWGQPFLSSDGRTSIIANGEAGRFYTPELQEKRCETALALEADGYSFSSRTEGAIGKYPTLSDGTAIHSTDLMCQYVARLIDRGMSPAEAMSEMMSELPCEAVFLLMREESPDSIFISRVNYPMTVGVAEDGDLYFATTRLAFPEDVAFREITFLPAMQTYEVTRGGYRAAPYPIRLSVKVAEITEEVVDRALPLIVRDLEGRPEPVASYHLIDSYASVWPKDELPQNEPMLYFLYERLAAEGRLGVDRHKEAGAAPGYPATRFGIYLKK